MPLISVETLKDQTSIGIWEISEPEEYFLSHVLLSEEELRHLDGRTTKLKQLQFLAARLLLGEISGERQPIHYQKTGRPFVVDSGLQLSISHSQNYVAVAISLRNKVGMDIESYPRLSLLRAKSYYLSDPELSDLTDENISVELLHVYWSAKEALFKYADRPEISLKEHLLVKPFQFNRSGHLSARIMQDDDVEEVGLTYRVESNYIFVVTGR